MKLPRLVSRVVSRVIPGAIARAVPGTAPSALRYFAEHATLRRPFGLLNDFKYEQTQPDIFYGHLAEDTVGLIRDVYRGVVGGEGGEDLSGAGGSGLGGADGTEGSNAEPSPLAGKKILDVGGGPGYFGVAFDREQADYYTCEPDVGEMAAAGITLQSSVRGSGLDLPFLDDSFDITYSSNVAEHVPDPWRMADEMLRVTRPGGMVIYSYTVWLGPFGGHETGLWQHYVGGEFAAQRYEKVHGKRPKNRWGESLFDVSAADGLAYARRADADLLASFPRYHPWWAWWMVRIPIVREFAVSNLVLVLRKR